MGKEAADPQYNTRLGVREQQGRYGERQSVEAQHMSEADCSAEESIILALQTLLKREEEMSELESLEVGRSW